MITMNLDKSGLYHVQISQDATTDTYAREDAWIIRQSRYKVIGNLYVGQIVDSAINAGLDVCLDGREFTMANGYQ